jgi:hypothetical protein
MNTVSLGDGGGWRVEGGGWRVEGGGGGGGWRCGGWKVEVWRVDGGGWRVEGGEPILTLPDTKTISLAPMTIETYVLHVTSDFSIKPPKQPPKKEEQETGTPKQPPKQLPTQPPKEQDSDFVVGPQQPKRKGRGSSFGDFNKISGLFFLYAFTVGAVVWMVKKKGLSGTRTFVVSFMCLFFFASIVQYYVFFG